MVAHWTVTAVKTNLIVTIFVCKGTPSSTLLSVILTVELCCCQIIQPQRHRQTITRLVIHVTPETLQYLQDICTV